MDAMQVTVDHNPSNDALAGFLETSVDALAAREQIYQPVGRWMVYRQERPIGSAIALVRPDGRLFVTARLQDEAGFGPLLDAAVADLDQPIHLSIADDDRQRLQTAKTAGFVVEMHSLTFAVPFETALARTAGRPSGRVELLTADQVDREALFDLDIELRQDVPGCEGWRGDRRWFDDEMTGSDFDPAAYLVARDRKGGDLVGLCRMWKHQKGPTLGLVGVRRNYRSGQPARMLIHAALTASEGWGFRTFAASTAHRSLQRRLRNFGAVETGGSTQLRR